MKIHIHKKARASLQRAVIHPVYGEIQYAPTTIKKFNNFLASKYSRSTILSIASLIRFYFIDDKAIMDLHKLDADFFLTDFKGKFQEMYNTGGAYA